MANQNAFFDYAPVAAGAPGAYNGLGPRMQQLWNSVPAADRDHAACYALRRAAFAPGVAAPGLGTDLPQGPATWQLQGGPDAYVAALFVAVPNCTDAPAQRDVFTGRVRLLTAGPAAGLTQLETDRVYGWAAQLLKAQHADRLPFLNEAQRNAHGRALDGRAGAPWRLSYMRADVPLNGPRAAEALPRLTRLLRGGFGLGSCRLWGNSQLSAEQRKAVISRWQREALIKRITAVFQQGGINGPVPAFAPVRSLLALYLYVSAIDVGMVFPNVPRVLQQQHDFRQDPVAAGSMPYAATLLKPL
jgi:hypothetical protein